MFLQQLRPLIANISTSDLMDTNTIRKVPWPINNKLFFISKFSGSYEVRDTHPFSDYDGSFKIGVKVNREG